jgi:hypothetical protein
VNDDEMVGQMAGMWVLWAARIGQIIGLLAQRVRQGSVSA